MVRHVILAGPVKVAADFAENIIIAGFLEIGHDDGFRIDLGFRAGFADLARHPEAERLVALGRRLEGELLVMRVFFFGGILALIE